MHGRGLIEGADPRAPGRPPASQGWECEGLSTDQMKNLVYARQHTARNGAPIGCVNTALITLWTWGHKASPGALLDDGKCKYGYGCFPDEVKVCWSPSQQTSGSMCRDWFNANPGWSRLGQHLYNTLGTGPCGAGSCTDTGYANMKRAFAVYQDLHAAAANSEPYKWSSRNSNYKAAQFISLGDQSPEGGFAGMGTYGAPIFASHAMTPVGKSGYHAYVVSEVCRRRVSDAMAYHVYGATWSFSPYEYKAYLHAQWLGSRVAPDYPYGDAWATYEPRRHYVYLPAYVGSSYPWKAGYTAPSPTPSAYRPPTSTSSAPASSRSAECFSYNRMSYCY